jgi:outer membrane murein-binding lipoprotein Lpp
MDANDGTNSTGAGPWEKARNIVVMAVLLLLSYRAGLGNGRGEKTATDYATLRSQYDKMSSEYDRAFGQYSAMKRQCDQTSAQYAALKAQYDRFEGRKTTNR